MRWIWPRCPLTRCCGIGSSTPRVPRRSWRRRPRNRRASGPRVSNSTQTGRLSQPKFVRAEIKLSDGAGGLAVARITTTFELPGVAFAAHFRGPQLSGPSGLERDRRSVGRGRGDRDGQPGRRRPQPSPDGVSGGPDARRRRRICGLRSNGRLRPARVAVAPNCAPRIVPIPQPTPVAAAPAPPPSSTPAVAQAPEPW